MKRLVRMHRRSWLKKSLQAGRSWGQLGWLYLVVGWSFLRWRVRLRLQRKHGMESTQERMKRTLLIIRHGQTSWNVEHRLPGQVAGVALNDTGRQQAQRLAEALSVLPLSAIISSPLERARDTAEYLLKGRELTIQFEPDLMDTNIGAWTGQKIDELAKNDPAWKAYVRDPTVAPEGVETFPQVQQRAVAAVERWLAQDDLGAYPVFVAHADVVKLLLAHYTGLDVARAGALLIDNASVSLVELEKEQHARILAMGWAPHPGWLKPPFLEGPKTADSVQETGEQKM